MSDDDSLKKTKKEGLSDAATEAVDRVVKARAEKAAVDPAHPVASTPHGKEDIDPLAKPSPSADSDDEAPLATFKKIDPEDRETAGHKGPGRAEGIDDDGHHEPPAHSAHSTRGGGPAERRAALLLAEYKSPGACLRAAEKLRDAGYTKFDTHTPFPVHGMDKAMGLADSKLGWLVFVMGLTGAVLGFTMMYWMNGIDYPIVIGGKPPGAVPSMVPILFELTILFASLTAVFGMLGMNKLPRHNHPLFESERFRGFSDDKFFVSVEVEDPKFKLERTRDLLEKTHAEHVELVEEDVS
jgi:hypothetical protein